LTKEIKKRGRGRPKKGEILAKKKPGKVGRPPGTSAIMQEYKARMLASPKSEAIIQKVMDTALEDGHPHQAACMKLVWDRVLPASYFEKDKAGGGSRAIEINLNFEDTPKASIVEEAVDVEFTTVDGDGNATD
jgi:hypothetical protein